MTTDIKTPEPDALGLQFFQAMLTKDFTTLTTTFKLTLDECKAIGLEQQQHAASKLIGAVNAIRRQTKEKVPAPAEKNPAPTVTKPKAVFHSTIPDYPSQSLPATKTKRALYQPDHSQQNV